MVAKLQIIIEKVGVWEQINVRIYKFVRCIVRKAVLSYISRSSVSRCITLKKYKFLRWWLIIAEKAIPLHPVLENRL